MRLGALLLLLTGVAGAGKPPDAVLQLGEGYRAFVAGDYAGARKILGGVDDKKLRNRDYHLWFLAQAEFFDDDAKHARAHFAALAKLAGRFQMLARWRAADCAFAVGDKAALAEYQALLASCNGRCDAAVDEEVALFRVAELSQARRLTEAAQKGWRRLYLDSPQHPLAERALARLVETQAPPISAAERLGRAKQLTAARLWTRALDELAVISGAPGYAELPESLRLEVDYWWGTTKFKMRRDYDLAAQKLLAVWPHLPTEERRAEALFHGARAWSRADHDDDAILNYKRLLEKFPHSRFAPEASFLIGWLDFNRGKYKEAQAGLQETLRRYGGSSFNDDARWYLGLSRWFAGDTEGALEDFRKLASMKGALTAGKGAYWAGRAEAKLGKKAEAIVTWRHLVAQYPLGYYATLARVRLRELEVEVDPFGGDEAKGGLAPPLAAKEDPSLAKDALFERVDELLRAGMTVEAGVELARGEGDAIRRFGAARALPALFARYLRGDNFYRLHRVAEAHDGGALRLDPHRDDNARRWWELIYPRAYRGFIEKYSPTGDNPPYYLYTIMQKESAYNPHDVSYADAIGLLQMIPPTSKNVAPHIDLPYTDDVLYDPEGNIRFGAWYIGHLLAKFKQQIPIGAGSFNSGPKPMRRWLKQQGERPLDEFIELCAYTQTREYMKKVVDIYAHYTWLYAHEDYQPSLKVDPVPLEDGLDY